MVPIGGVGNTRGDAANFVSLINDVERKLFDRLPDETWFYPGPGKDSTLGAERPSLADWRSRPLPPIKGECTWFDLFSACIRP
ncbi:hypothetical protein Pa4123_28900 [Phytohabitans aurantiacus]|uniref:Uncharacterized protein n=1 Tax=Phytohabitans aurantiacus TaxID=3016789 RepID=A0ABQ5QSN5_9ACTN|nr:hypothetical protein Pa4123_28900 [Phytohabitans aurantiacus]